MMTKARPFRSRASRPTTSYQELRVTDPDIVAVTSREDLGADLVILACSRRGVPIFRLNSEDYPREIKVRIAPLDPDASCLMIGGDEVRVGRCRGVWIRRPQWPRVSREMSQIDQRLAAQESVAALGGLWRLLGSRCISHPDALTAARWKLPQLQRARALGFRTPETIVTMDPAEATTFVQKGPTVIKAIQELYIGEGAESRYGAAAPARVEDAASVADCPTLFQRMVPKGADVRVTVVDGHVFAVRIRLPAGAPLDFRETPPDETEFEVMDLPNGLEEACRRLVADAGLRFGAIDLVEDPSGVLWFLECNPNGQWGWLEQATGLPITDALVDALLLNQRVATSQ